MGTGKTKSAIWAFDFLKSVGRAKRMLVVAPLSTLRFTWEREIFNTIPAQGDGADRHGRAPAQAAC